MLGDALLIPLRYLAILPVLQTHKVKCDASHLEALRPERLGEQSLCGMTQIPSVAISAREKREGSLGRPGVEKRLQRAHPSLLPHHAHGGLLLFNGI